MLWFLLGLVIGHYVVPDIKKFINRRQKSDN